MKLQLSVCGCAVLCAGASAYAGTTDVWNEVGDAGQHMSDAQVITGPPGFLRTINGTLGEAGDVDLYTICLDVPDAFSAIARSTVGGPSPQLFLFDEFGNGVKYSASADPLAPSWFDNLWIDSPGLYYLAVASRDALALGSGGQQIWMQDTGSQFAPNGPAADQHLNQWNFTEGIHQGPYEVEIRGVDFFPALPAPSTLAALGMLALTSHRRRRA